MTVSSASQDAALNRLYHRHQVEEKLDGLERKRNVAKRDLEERQREWREDLEQAEKSRLESIVRSEDRMKHGYNNASSEHMRLYYKEQLQEVEDARQKLRSME